MGAAGYAAWIIRMSNELINPQPTAVAGILDKPVENREAWRLLQAEYGNQGIEPDKWRLLGVAFANTPDDVLTMAVIKHMTESPFFPRLSDINKQLQAMRQLTPFEIFCEQIGRLGYKLASDNDGEAVFSNGIQEAVVRH